MTHCRLAALAAVLLLGTHWAPIPEPATPALVIGGLAIIGALTRRRWRQARRVVGKAGA